MKFLLSILLVFVFKIDSVVITGASGSEHTPRNLSKPEACPILHKDLKRATSEVLKHEGFRNYLIKKNIIVTPGEPAFLFFNRGPLSDELDKLYHRSEQVLEISGNYAEYLFRNNLPRSQNINPLLRKNSCCLEKYFDKFCTDNNNYKCKPNQKYRRIDGFCTSLHCPKEGAAITAYASLLPQNYEDSISQIRKEVRTKDHLPLARELVTKLLDRCVPQDVFLEYAPSLIGSQFSVFIAADVSFLGYPRSYPSINCCKKDYSSIVPKELRHPSCDAIKIPQTDKFFGPLGMTCMNFLRSQNVYDNNCELTSRKQLNVATSFLDMSTLYGTSKQDMYKLRSFIDGTLKTNSDNLFAEDENGLFIVPTARLLSGSPVSALLNVLFMREHNRIAKDIKTLFPQWSDESIFQEARRWNIAQYQVIVKDWLSIFMGDQYKNLKITKDEEKFVTAATTNEFAHGVFRVPHKLISETIQFYDETGNKVNELPLNDANPSVIIRQNFDNLVRALFYQKTNFNGCHTQIMNQLFKNAAGIGIDVFSFDIKRGRDHGVQPYHKYVELCLKKKIHKFSDLKGLISDQNINLLQGTYDSVHDIDLYVGANLEITPNEYQYGPITSCIINEQFYRYRRGDPFYYDNPKQNYPFTAAQLVEINKSSFARILCNNANIVSVAKNPFIGLIPAGLNEKVNCDTVPKVNVVY